MCICVSVSMYGCETVSVGVLYECIMCVVCVCTYGCETVGVCTNVAVYLWAYVYRVRMSVGVV